MPWVSNEFIVKDRFVLIIVDLCSRGYIFVISSEPPCEKGHAKFTLVFLTTLSDQCCGRYRCLKSSHNISILSVLRFASHFQKGGNRKQFICGIENRNKEHRKKNNVGFKTTKTSVFLNLDLICCHRKQMM